VNFDKVATRARLNPAPVLLQKTAYGKAKRNKRKAKREKDFFEVVFHRN
jgi:hypothetical protein